MRWMREIDVQKLADALQRTEGWSRLVAMAYARRLLRKHGRKFFAEELEK